MKSKSNLKFGNYLPSLLPDGSLGSRKGESQDSFFMLESPLLGKNGSGGPLKCSGSFVQLSNN